MSELLPLSTCCDEQGPIDPMVPIVLTLFVACCVAVVGAGFMTSEQVGYKIAGTAIVLGSGYTGKRVLFG